MLPVCSEPAKEIAVGAKRRCASVRDAARPGKKVRFPERLLRASLGVQHSCFQKNSANGCAGKWFHKAQWKTKFWGAVTEKRRRRGRHCVSAEDVVRLAVGAKDAACPGKKVRFPERLLRASLGVRHSCFQKNFANGCARKWFHKAQWRTKFWGAVTEKCRKRGRHCVSAGGAVRPSVGAKDTVHP